MLHHKKIERWIDDCFPVGAKVTYEVVPLAPPATPTNAAFPDQANTAIDRNHSKNFNKEKITEMETNLNMSMASQIN
jgi:hypothetical protein